MNGARVFGVGIRSHAVCIVVVVVVVAVTENLTLHSNNEIRAGGFVIWNKWWPWHNRMDWNGSKLRKCQPTISLWSFERQLALQQRRSEYTTVAGTINVQVTVSKECEPPTNLLIDRYYR